MSALPRRSASSPVRLERLADGAVLALVYAYLLSQLPPRLLLSQSIAAGGDIPSHYHTLLCLKDRLLAHGRVSGWTQANYAGFPILQNYFPLPFVAMALLCALVTAPVAFKLGTVLGVFLLPACAYAAMKLMGAAFPVPALAAAGTLPFLFLESNSFWGGNIPSMLSGEFAYSLGLSLTVLWLGSLYRGIATGRLRAANAALLACIGFSHGYPLLFAGFFSLFFLLDRERFRENLLYLAVMHGTAVLLMGFWLLPLLARLPWTTAYDTMLPLSDLRLLFPKLLVPQSALCALAFARERGAVVRGLAWAAGCAVLLFMVGPALGVVDFRFLPFLQVAVVLAAPLGLVGLTRRLRGAWLVAPLVALGTVLWVDWNVGFIPQWVRWNYGGFEEKPLWPAYRRVNDLLRGSAQDPRVVYEHSTRHNAIGSLRAWESLPVFSGRSTLEHAYFQASPSAPFVFYLQSEISREISCPFPDYGCTSLDLERAKRHLDLFNVRELVVVSEEVKALLRKTPGYRFKASVPPYEVFEREGERRYVEVPAFEPVLWTGALPWKAAAYAWFRNPRADAVPLVFPVGFQREDFDRFALRAERPSDIPRRPLAGKGAVVREKISDEEVEFETEGLGRPHLVKFSYHPNWRVEGADKVYLVSPSFMLVYPNRRSVRLYYARAWPEYCGLAMTFAGLLLVAWLAWGARRPPPDPGSGRTWRSVRGLSAVCAAAALLASGLAAWGKRTSASDELLAGAVRYRDRREFDRAEPILRRLSGERPSSRFAESALYYLGTVYYLQDRCEPAIGAFSGLLERFPDSALAAESAFHIGLCEGRLGHKAKAEETKALLLERFPGTPWAKLAGERL